MDLNNTGWLMPQDGSEDDDLLTQFLKSKKGGALPPNLYANKNGTSSADTNKTGTKTIVSRSIYPDEGDIKNQQAQLNFLRTQPEFQGQQEGIKNFEDALSMVKNVPARDDSWVKPLVALASAESGKPLMEGYEQNAMSSKDKYNQILKYQDEISKRKAEQGKELLQGLAASKVGTSLTALTAENALTGKTSNEDTLGAKPVKAGGGVKSKYQDAYDVQAGKDLAKFVAEGGYANGKSLLGDFQEARDLVAKQRNSVVDKTLGEGVMSQLYHGAKSFLPASDDYRLTQLITKLSSPDVKENFTGTGRMTQQEWSKMMSAYTNPAMAPAERDRILDEGFTKMEQALEEKKSAAAYADTHGTLKGYKSEGLGGADFKQSLSGSGGGKPTSIKQNGHTYILNPKTGQYE